MPIPRRRDAIAWIERALQVDQRKRPRSAGQMLDLFLNGRTVPQHPPEEVGLHLQLTTGHDVVESRHPLEKGNILK